MAFDSHSNFGRSLVVTAPVPATSGTSLVVTTGTGALFPSAPFNCTVSPAGVLPLNSNAEIVRVTAVVGDTLTIVRAQEGTSAKSIAAGWQIFNCVSVKVFTDIQNAMIQSISAGTTNATGSQVVFSNSNGISFGAAGNVITASVAAAGGGLTNINLSAGTTSQNLSALTLSNSNGVSFGLNGSVITASVAAGGGAAISAGANSQSTGTVEFSNSNGVTFGLDGAGVMTASHNGLTSQSNQAFSAQGGSTDFQTLEFANSNGITFSNSNGSVVASHNGLTSQSNQNVTAGNGGFAFQTLSFSNANGISFGTSAGSAITGSHNALTSQSNQAASASNGSFAFQTLGFSNGNGVTFGTSAGSIISASVSQTVQPVAASASNGSFLFSTLGFSNGNGVTFGTSAGSIITASVAAAGGAQTGISGIQVSNTTYTSGTVTFQNANGISFGSSGANGISASYTVPTVTNSSWSVSDAATSGTVARLAFTNLNGVTLSLSTGAGGSHTIVGSHNAITQQSTQPVNASAGNGSFNFSTISFSNANGISFSTTAGSGIVASHNALTSQSNQAFSNSAGSFTFQTLNFSNANGVTFGTSAGGIVTASVAAAGGAQTGISGIVVSNTTYTSGTVTFQNANGISFGSSGANGISASYTVPTQSTQPVAASASNGSFLFSTLGFSNANGVTFGTSAGSIVTASITTGTPLKYFANFNGMVNTAAITLAQSTSAIVPLFMDTPISFDFLRIIASGNVVAASTTAATTGNTQFSCGYTKSHNFVFYSRGNGASSASLQSYFSTQILENYSHNVSAAANSTQFSYSQRYSLPCSSGTTGFTHDYSSSAASLNFNSASATMLTSHKQMDFSMATTLSAGQWWLMYGISSTSSSQFTSVGFRNIVTFNPLCVSGQSMQFGPLGSSIQNTMMPAWGNGSFTTAGGGTTGSLNFTNISSNTSNQVIYYQLMASN